MILFNDFLLRWNSELFPLLPYERKAVDMLSVRAEDKEFLLKVGMPVAAAPYLNFSNQPRSFGKYFIIGYTGSGDIICIEGNKVVIVNHERSGDAQFMNSSLSQLVDFLLGYAEFITKIKIIFGRKAFLEKAAPASTWNEIKDQFNGIDPDAIMPGCFWFGELEQYKRQ